MSLIPQHDTQARKETLCPLHREEIGKKTILEMSSKISVMAPFPVVLLKVGDTEFGSCVNCWIQTWDSLRCLQEKIPTNQPNTKPT